MSGLTSLVKFAERRTEDASAAWQRLRAQCDEARHKLVLLTRHAENYRDRMRAGLHRGMPAGSTISHIGFIGQIEVVVARQQSELASLEQVCARQWQALIDARRDQRMYEILSERAAARDAQTASRRRQADTDELLQRAATRPRRFGIADSLTKIGNTKDG